MRTLHSVEVRGNSMAPTFNEGDWLLFRKVSGVHLEKLVGNVVLVSRQSDTGQGLLQIKRVIRIEAQKIWVEGDNKTMSTDSRSWGALNPDEVIGKLLFRYHRSKKVSE